MVFSLNVQTLDSIHGYETTNKTGTEMFGRNRRGKHYHAMIILVQATENVELSPVNCHIVIIATSMFAATNFAPLLRFFTLDTRSDKCA